MDGYTGVSGQAWLILWISGLGMTGGALREVIGGLVVGTDEVCSAFV